MDASVEAAGHPCSSTIRRIWQITNDRPQRQEVHVVASTAGSIAG
jgi:hypothetical protein